MGAERRESRRTGMLKEVLTLIPQKYEGQYDFELPVRTSEPFNIKFGEMAAEIVSKAVEMIRNNHPHPHYLQELYYGKQKIWCFSAIQKSDIYDDKHINFLLPEEY